MITTTNCVEYLLELEGKLEFIWDNVFSELWGHHYNIDVTHICLLVILHEKYISKIYWNGFN